MEEFFNSFEEIAQKLESKRSENTVHSRTKQRPVDRPVDRRAQRAQAQLSRPPGRP